MKKGLLPMLLSASMIASLLPVPAMAATTFNDVQGHWGERAVERWVNYGIVNGDNGQFRPDDSLTRGEMAVIISNLLKLEAKTGNNPFSDLDESWYTEALLACYEAGIFSGDAAGTIRPQDTITRQEAMVVLGNALRIAPKEGTLSDFNDGAEVADWAAGFVKALTDAGIVNGVGDHMLQPTAEISRASVVTILNNAVNGYANKDGESIEATGGLVIVTSKDVVVTGSADNVLVLSGAAEGEVTLDNLNVNGTVTVEGQNTKVVLSGATDVTGVVFGNDTEGAALTVGKDANAGDVTVGAANTAVDVQGTVGNIDIAESAEKADVVIAADAKATSVTVMGANANVTVEGKVEEVSLLENAEESKVTVGKDATIDSLKTEAPKTDILVQGQVSDATVEENAAESTMKVESSGTVTDLTTDAEGVTVSGNGKVENAVVSGDKTAINTDGTKLEVSEGTVGVTENGSSVDENDKTTTGETSTSGGSSSSSSESSTKKYTVTFGLTEDGQVYFTSRNVKAGGTTFAATAQELGYTLPEGKQITWYDTNGNLFDFTEKINNSVMLVGVVGSDAFAGGNGTETYPYLISNAKELKGIKTLEKAMLQDSFNFELTADIDLSQETTYETVKYFQGVLNGNNHQIIGFSENASGDKNLFADSLKDAEFRDFTLVVNGGQCTTILSCINRYIDYNQGNIKFVNVDVMQKEDGTVVSCGNNDGPYCNFAFDGTVTFENCNNYADFNFVTYGGLYVGGYAYDPTTVIFKDCTNYGNLTGANVALFIGNPTKGTPNVTVEDCTNAGVVHGVTTEGWFSRYNGSSSYDELNNSVVVNGNPVGDISAIEVEITNVQKNEDGTISFTSDHDEYVDYYIVRARHSSSFKREDGTSGGSSYVCIEERIDAGGTVQTTIPFGNYTMFIDSSAYGEPVEYTDRESYVNARYAVLDNGTVVFDANDMMEAQDDDIKTVSMKGAPTYIIEAYSVNNVILGEKELDAFDSEQLLLMDMTNAMFEETVGTAPDDEETVGTAPDDKKTAGTAPDDEETVGTAPDDEETVGTAPDDEETVGTAPDDEETVGTAPDDEETVGTAPDDEETVGTAIDDEKTAGTVSEEKENDLLEMEEV